MPRKILVLVILITFVISICAVCTKLYLEPFLKKKILEEAEKAFGKKFRLSSLDMNLLKGVVFLSEFGIEDSKLLKYRHAVEADEIILDIDLPVSIIKRKPVFERVYLKDFILRLENREMTHPPTLTALPEVTLSPSKTLSTDMPFSRKKSDVFFDLFIDQLEIENSKFVFVDHKTEPLPATTEIVNVNGRVKDILVSGRKGIAYRGNLSLRGTFNSEREGLLKIEGTFSKSDVVNFDLDLDLDKLDLISFAPYYSNTSFTILKKAKLDLHSKARCQKNQLNAYQNARIYDIELHTVTITKDDRLFGLPARTAIEFFQGRKNDIEFDFNIVGTINDPKFDPGPVIKQVLSNAMRDEIIARLQELPREVIKMSEKAINEHLKIEDKLKTLDKGEIVDTLKDLKKEIKKIIDY